MVGDEQMAKKFKAFRFSPRLYEQFKMVAHDSSYTVTGAFERFMERSVEHGKLIFPPMAKSPDFEAEARVLLVWLKRKKTSYFVGEEEISVEGRLLQLLAIIRDDELKTEIEETLKRR